MAYKDTLLRQSRELDDRAVRLQRRAENLQYRDKPDNPYIIEARERADPIYREFGASAPTPLRGEDDFGYRLRVLDELKKHSPKHRDTPLRTLTNLTDRAFNHVEDEILDSAKKVAENWAEPGTLRERHIVDSVTGSRRTEFAGSSTLTWMETFMQPKKVFTGFFPGSGVNWKPFITRGKQ
jgi:hypothetical protein